jgi:hypothetical protein
MEELSQSEYDLLRIVCNDPNMDVFSQSSPIATDDEETVSQAQQAAIDAERMVTIGLLRNITDNHKAQLAQMNKQTGRQWRVYQITPMTKALFQATHYHA